IADGAAELDRIDHVGVAAVDIHLAACRFDQAVDHLHRRRLAAARGAEQDADLARRHLEADRSEEHTSELQSLMRISYAVLCLKKKKKNHKTRQYTLTQT